MLALVQQLVPGLVGGALTPLGPPPSAATARLHRRGGLAAGARASAGRSAP